MDLSGLRTLVAYSSASAGTQTTREYLDAFADHLPGEVAYLHVTNGAGANLDLDTYDVVINSYCARLCIEGYVSESYRNKLRAFRGLKIIAVQDEYENTNYLKAQIHDLGFDILLTCVPQDALDYVYPRAEFERLRIETVLTGYVPNADGSGASRFRPLSERPIMIGYRGRDIGGLYGRLGFDKFEIGRRMREICEARGIVSDIRTDEEGRIYGSAWYDFIASCRTALGTESGSNVFDFDGSLRRSFDALTRMRGQRPSYAEFAPVIAERDGAIEMGQISPRIFEYASARTPMILFRGRYSDAIVPGEHYLLLEKDFSNVDDVLHRLDDLDGLEAMAERAYETLIRSGCYSYAGFMGRIAEIIAEELPRIHARKSVAVPTISENTGINHHPVLVQSPSSRPLGFPNFRLRRDFVAFQAEIDRMLKIEDQVIEGYDVKLNILRARLVGGGEALSDCLADCRSAFARMHGERDDALSELYEQGRLRSIDALESALTLYERQVHEMYALYGRMDTAYAVAVAEPLQEATRALHDETMAR